MANPLLWLLFGYIATVLAVTIVSASMINR